MSEATGLLSVPFQAKAAEGPADAMAAKAAAMVWFKGRLYVAAQVSHPMDVRGRTRIVAHNPDSKSWEVVYESPDFPVPLPPDLLDRARGLGYLPPDTAPHPTGHNLARDTGVQSMLVFAGKSDDAPCLYCSVMSLAGGLILRSADGRHFAPVCAPGIENDRNLAFSSLTAFGGRLFAAASGSIFRQELDYAKPPKATLYVSDDPGSAVWERAAMPGFGDTANTAISAVAATAEHVFAGTCNPTRGFQLWRSKAEGSAPFHWEKVLEQGAWRYNLNQMVAQMAVFGDDLYIGSALPGLGEDPRNQVGPGACEVIRLCADGRWDLLVGEPRFSPDGLKVPLSALGPGFNDPFNAGIWSFAAHEGRLYAGTRHWAAADPAHGKRRKKPGGYQLWVSGNGTDWQQCLAQNTDKTGAIGIRAMCPTPSGLFLIMSYTGDPADRPAAAPAIPRTAEATTSRDILFELLADRSEILVGQPGRDIPG